MTEQRNDAAKDLLQEKGPQALELIHKSLNDDNLTPEQRQRLEKTAAMLAGYQMSFWLPTTLDRKVLMFLFLALGVFGVLWSPWFAIFILLCCSFSPRVVGEVSFFIGNLSK